MEIILADKNALDIRRIMDADIDVDCGGTNDFELTLSQDIYQSDLAVGNILYAPGTEYGGIIGEIDTDTSTSTILVKGYIWRGLLARKVIEPPSGQPYRVVTGELNKVMADIIGIYYDGIFAVSTEDTGVSVTNYQFDRYINILEGFAKMLATKGYRLQITYEQNNPGQVVLAAEPITDYSGEIELSQDSRLNFSMKNVQNGINHLICLGAGEGTARTVVHLYAGPDGISQTQYYFGIDELVDTYDYNNAEDTAELIKGGTERLEQIMNSKTMEMDVASLDIDVQIGDIVGGRDYITGETLKQPLLQKIWKQTDGIESVEYKVEGTQ